MRAFLSMIAFSMRRVRADADARVAHRFVLRDRRGRLVEVGAEHDRAVQTRSGQDEAADADDRLVDVGVRDDAAVRDDRVIDLGAVDLRRRQKARARVDRRGHVEEIEPRQLGREVQVGLEERADRADVLPVALEDVRRRRGAIRDRAGNDVLAEVGQVVLRAASMSTSRLNT